VNTSLVSEHVEVEDLALLEQKLALEIGDVVSYRIDPCCIVGEAVHVHSGRTVPVAVLHDVEDLFPGFRLFEPVPPTLDLEKQVSGDHVGRVKGDCYSLYPSVQHVKKRRSVPDMISRSVVDERFSSRATL